MMNTIAHKMANVSYFNNSFKQKIQSFLIQLIPAIVYGLFIMWTPTRTIIEFIIPDVLHDVVPAAYIFYFIFVRPWEAVRYTVWSNIIFPIVINMGVALELHLERKTLIKKERKELITKNKNVHMNKKGDTVVEIEDEDITIVNIQD